MPAGSRSSMAEEQEEVFVHLKCPQQQQQQQQQQENENDEETHNISTKDVKNWNFSSILQHPIIIIHAHKHTLVQHSTYFHALLAEQYFSDPDFEVLVKWNQTAFVILVASLFGYPLEFTSENFLPIFEGALYFGMDMILSECKTWLTNAMLVNEVPSVQLKDLVNIWEFGSEIGDYIPELCTSYLAKNFIWAMSCSSFDDVSHDLLRSTIKHPYLTVDSEKQLCDAILAWITANKQQCTEDVCINLLKQIRISLLPLWYAAGKYNHPSLSICFTESSRGAVSLLKQPLGRCMDALGDVDLLIFRIRLSEFTQRVDLSGCPQIKLGILLLSIIPYSISFEPMWKQRVEQLYMNHGRLSGNAFSNSYEIFPKLTFEAVREIDISNCPMLHLEIAIECFSKSFPSLKMLKAVNHLDFRTAKLMLLMKRCPLLCDIDLSVDVPPTIPTKVSVLSSFGSFDYAGPSLHVPWPYMSRPSPSSITKLTIEGRNDFNDFDLRSISDICVSLTYLNLKGCTSVSDAGISSLISKCLKLNSIVACDTFFGEQSVLALCFSNTCSDHVTTEHTGKNIPWGSNLKLLCMGGCKGVTMATFSKLMSQAYMLKHLSLRETQVVDGGLLSFCGSLLEVLDVSNSKVSVAALAHVISRNPGLKCLNVRGCCNLLQEDCKPDGDEISSSVIYMELGKSCKLDEFSVGWGFSYLSLETLKPAISLLKTIEVGLGGSLGQDGLKWLPVICPLLESVVLYYQVISDDLIVNMMESLRNLKSFSLCHCLGETSFLSFKVSMPNLKNLRLERVASRMNNADLISLTQNCANLTALSLVGCRLLNSESQKIISSGWPALISIHLEECGEVTSNGVVSFFECHALEDVLLRHNGSGIQKSFVTDAVMKLPMLRKISLDICDAKDRDFDIPEFAERHFLSHVKIARCKSQRCSFNPDHVMAPRPSIHRETLVLVWDSKQLTKTVVKERL
uniref:BTB/POZ domain-containing protein FBL11 n=1 Tax=Erigeron canadensis TaxID=72917 RepID=UPI001CB97337|nr:BTB/POZ domain-containing protein FBL11 [Erigeron canadensis]